MKITKDEAFELAKKTKENGCCSQYGQTIVYLMDEIDELKFILMECYGYEFTGPIEESKYETY